MNTLVFLAGMGAGILAMTFLIGLFIALNRRVSKAQLEVNERQFLQMDEGNRLRQVRADAMNRIADALEISVHRKG